MPLGFGAILGSNLEFHACPFDGIVNAEGFSKVARHWLFAINVLSCFHGINSYLSVPMVHSTDENDIDVFVL